MSNFDIQTEKYIEHEVKLRLHDHLYKQLNRKLDIIMATCAATFTVILVPVVLHSLRLV